MDRILNFREVLNLKEEELLRKYGKLMRTYFEKKFEEYLSLDYILSHRDISVSEAIKSRFDSREDFLKEDATHSFYNVLKNKLKVVLRRTLLEWEPNEAVTLITAPSTTAKSITGERTLILHYLMKAAGIRLNKGQRAAQIRFIAYLTSENENNIKDYYPYLSKPLNNKKLAVLKSVIPLLDDLQATDLIARIKDDISNAINETEE